MPDPGTAAATSIRRRLLFFLIPSLLFLVLCGGVLTYGVALSVATSAYDRSLLDPALDMAENIRVGADGPHLDLLMQAQQALMYDHVDTMVFQIRDAEGRVIAGADDLAAAPALRDGETRFFDGVYRNDPVRIAAVRTDGGFSVQVGETLFKRQLLIWEILAAELVPTLLIAFAAIALAWTGVKHGVAPLARIRTELLGRGPNDLRPLTETGAPAEIAPAVKAFNKLLGRMREASGVQQRFLANAAHQLRTPLAGLQMHLELLLRRELAPDVRSEIEGMHVATMRASHLATQLLALARAEAGGVNERNVQHFDLRQIADAAAQEWVPRAIARNIDLGFVLESAIVSGNPLLLSELLNNLVDNALRYTPSGGTVTVHSGMDDDGRPYLSVEDNGVGIPEDARSKVFERFYRIEGTPGDGSGLGLAIVKEVVDRHNGVLTVQSGATSGTRIVVTFAAPADAPVRQAAPTSHSAPTEVGPDAAVLHPQVTAHDRVPG
ncbi:MAG TPA: sensor histidine kinase [Casimicrobiaceae bacterium]|jgi:two-component system sensor histidine kinase TctE|nr:sensor histidine kinase [Casimicrobiaceae bacterium]